MQQPSVGMETIRTVRFTGMPEGRWRVMWHGDVGFHRRDVTWSQPTINVVLQREDHDSKPSVSASFAIAQLWALRIGSVWQDTKLVPAEHLGEEREFTFPVSAIGHCVAGVPLTSEAGSDYLIPFGHFPHHREHTRAHCLRVLVDDVHVILPAIEVIRFYFGSSGMLLKRLFSSQFAVDKLRISASNSHGTAKVELAPDMPRSSGVDVARIVFSREAFRAASSVGRSLLAASSDQRDGHRSSYARTELPYSGCAVLSVRGLAMTAGDGQSRFMVTEILTCASRLPWTSLSVVASPQGKPAVNSADSAATEAGENKAAQSIANRAPGKRIEPREASGKSGLRFQSYVRWMRFTDLLKKPVNYIDAEEKNQVRLRSLPAATFDSTSDGGSPSAGGRRVEMILNDASDGNLLQSPVKAWSSFFDLIRELDNEPWVEKTEYVRIPDEECSHHAFLPEIFDATDATLPETIGDPAAANQIRSRRRASFVNVKVINVSLAVISLAPRPFDSCQTIMVWAGVRLESMHALGVLHAALTAAGPHWHIELPLPCSDHLTKQAYRDAAVALLRCARGWRRFAR